MWINSNRILLLVTKVKLIQNYCLEWRVLNCILSKRTKRDKKKKRKNGKEKKKKLHQNRHSMPNPFSTLMASNNARLIVNSADAWETSFVRVEKTFRNLYVLKKRFYRERRKREREREREKEKKKESETTDTRKQSRLRAAESNGWPETTWVIENN